MNIIQNDIYRIYDEITTKGKKFTNLTHYDLEPCFSKEVEQECISPLECLIKHKSQKCFNFKVATTIVKRNKCLICDEYTDLHTNFNLKISKITIYNHYYCLNHKTKVDTLVLWFNLKILVSYLQSYILFEEIEDYVIFNKLNEIINFKYFKPRLQQVVYDIDELIEQLSYANRLTDLDLPNTKETMQYKNTYVGKIKTFKKERKYFFDMCGNIRNIFEIYENEMNKMYTYNISKTNLYDLYTVYNMNHQNLINYITQKGNVQNICNNPFECLIIHKDNRCFNFKINNMFDLDLCCVCYNTAELNVKYFDKTTNEIFEIFYCMKHEKQVTSLIYWEQFKDKLPLKCLLENPTMQKKIDSKLFKVNIKGIDYIGKIYIDDMTYFDNINIGIITKNIDSSEFDQDVKYVDVNSIKYNNGDNFSQLLTYINDYYVFIKYIYNLYFEILKENKLKQDDYFVFPYIIIDDYKFTLKYMIKPNYKNQRYYIYFTSIQILEGIEIKESELFLSAYTSVSECGSWRLLDALPNGQYNKFDNYLQSTILHIELQQFIYTNMNYLPNVPMNLKNVGYDVEYCANDPNRSKADYKKIYEGINNRGLDLFSESECKRLQNIYENLEKEIDENININIKKFFSEIKKNSKTPLFSKEQQNEEYILKLTQEELDKMLYYIPSSSYIFNAIKNKVIDIKDVDINIGTDLNNIIYNVKAMFMYLLKLKISKFLNNIYEIISIEPVMTYFGVINTFKIKNLTIYNVKSYNKNNINKKIIFQVGYIDIDYTKSKTEENNIEKKGFFILNILDDNAKINMLGLYDKYYNGSFTNAIIYNQERRSQLISQFFRGEKNPVVNIVQYVTKPIEYKEQTESVYLDSYKYGLDEKTKYNTEFINSMEYVFIAYKNERLFPINKIIEHIKEQESYFSNKYLKYKNKYLKYKNKNN